MLENAHIAATFLGYPTMVLLALAGLWAAFELLEDIYRTWRRFVYNRRQAKIADKEWDDIRASWNAETRQDRQNTDVLSWPINPDLTHQNVYDQMKETQNDRS